MTPGFGVGKAKVDEVPTSKRGPGIAAGLGGLKLDSGVADRHHPAVRLPPGMKRGASGNL